jgi:hypothetical protein
MELKPMTGQERELNGSAEFAEAVDMTEDGGGLTPAVFRIGSAEVAAYYQGGVLVVAVDTLTAGAPDVPVLVRLDGREVYDSEQANQPAGKHRAVPAE